MNMLSLRRPSPALVISVIALFVALGGTSYAASELGHSPAATPATAKLKRKPASAKRQGDGADQEARAHALGQVREDVG